MQTIDYRRGLPAMAACFLIWGFQPLYWYMCTNVCGEIDTFSSWPAALYGRLLPACAS